MNYKTNSLVVAGEHSLTENTAVVAGYEYVQGDLEYNTFRLGVKTQF